MTGYITILLFATVKVQAALHGAAFTARKKTNFQSAAVGITVTALIINTIIRTNLANFSI